jgi:hypothetical protein
MGCCYFIGTELIIGWPNKRDRKGIQKEIKRHKDGKTG